jgi:hypothetical protein
MDEEFKEISNRLEGHIQRKLAADQLRERKIKIATV